MSGAILPGATIGVLGGGQLGRMFAIAARRMGYRVHTFSPDNDTPTGQVAVTSSQRSAPGYLSAPKSSCTVKIPFATATALRATVTGDGWGCWVPPLRASHTVNCKS